MTTVTTTTFSAETIAALEESITRKSTGKAVEEYEIGGRRVKYDTLSLNEMLNLLNTMRRAVANQANAANNTQGRRRYSLLTTGKGL